MDLATQLASVEQLLHFSCGGSPLRIWRIGSLEMFNLETFLFLTCTCSVHETVTVIADPSFEPSIHAF